MTFKDALKEDINVFMNSEEFGEVAVFSRSGLEINVLLDKEQEQETGRIVDVMTVSVSDIVGIQTNDTFTIGATVFTYISKYPEPVGELMCMLRVES